MGLTFKKSKLANKSKFQKIDYIFINNGKKMG